MPPSSTLCQVMYRWQRGFRRSSNGQYKKVFLVIFIDIIIIGHSLFENHIFSILYYFDNIDITITMRDYDDDDEQVPILRVSLQYSDAPALLPSHLQVNHHLRHHHNH